MSTNSECEFIQWENEEWYYILEDYNAPKNAWDWKEYASAYGPFKTEEIANHHLCDNHTNPGGSYTDIDPRKTDDVLINLISDARARSKQPKRQSTQLFYY
tara:strand:+ start:3336 stop:3638 length:303 start_codon:yes stop_codon:yes gene_type:complete